MTSPADIFVTGASGFIGKALCARLADEGIPHRTGARGPLDLRGCSALVHLSYPLTPGESAAVFEAAATTDGLTRVVLMSSVKAMAETSPPGHPLTEADPPRPTSAYGHAKLAVEAQARHHGAAGAGYDLVILRPPVVHGPGARGPLATLAAAVRAGVPLPLGGIRNARSLLGIDNLLDAVLTCLSASSPARGEYLLADGPAVSTTALVVALAQAAGRPARLLPAPRRLITAATQAIGRPTLSSRLFADLALDDSAARAALPWSPRRSLEAGLALMQERR